MLPSWVGQISTRLYGVASHKVAAFKNDYVQSYYGPLKCDTVESCSLLKPGSSLGFGPVTQAGGKEVGQDPIRPNPQPIHFEPEEGDGVFFRNGGINIPN